MISLALLAFVVSLVATLWVRRLFQRQCAPYADDAPQRFHFGETPRMGGLGMLIGWAVLIPSFFAGIEAAVIMLRRSVGSPDTTDGTSLMSDPPSDKSFTALQLRNAEFTSI